MPSSRLGFLVHIIMADRPWAPESIVAILLDDQAISVEKIGMCLIFGSWISDDQAIVQWLARHQLIANQRLCDACHENCNFTRDATHQHGFRWTYFRRHNKISIFCMTLLCKRHLNLKTMVCYVLLLCWYATKIGETWTTYQLKPNNGRLVSFFSAKFFALEWHEPTRTWWLRCKRSQYCCGDRRIKIFHRKYHRGQCREGHLGLVPLSVLVEVVTRDANTLLPLIEQHILPGTQIMFDGWGAFANVGNINGAIYSHDVIVDERHFVDLHDPSIHTQIVENMWMRVKRKLKRGFGTSRNLFPSYLSKFQWRSNFHDHVFEQFLIAITHLYQLKHVLMLLYILCTLLQNINKSPLSGGLPPETPGNHICMKPVESGTPVNHICMKPVEPETPVNDICMMSVELENL